MHILRIGVTFLLYTWSERREMTCSKKFCYETVICDSDALKYSYSN